METIKDILSHAVHEMGIQKKFRAQFIIFHWGRIVGEDIASQSKPLSIQYGTMLLAVKNSVWCHHLSMMTSQLIQKVNAYAGEIIVKEIRFRNESWHDCDEECGDEELNFGRKVRRVLLDKREVALTSSMVENVKEAGLKVKLQALLNHHLAGQKVKEKEHWHTCEKCSVLCPKEDKFCSACKIADKQERMQSIRSCLITVPWATYGEVNQQIACSNREYIDAKLSLLAVIASKIADEKQDKILVWTLAMLYTGAKNDELSDKLIEKTMLKFRRKKYVSASGV